MTKPGALLWRGASLLDGREIIAVLTFGSVNRKTGPMAQTWVLRADADPQSAVNAHDDRAICGSCVHRGADASTRTCYVQPWLHGPGEVYKAFVKGLYVSRDLDGILTGERVRLCAYGDPGAVPFDVWRDLVDRGKPEGWTGYTHTWQTCDQRLSRLCMASVDTPAERDAAHAAGWRTFRTRSIEEPTAHRESVCPASKEGRYRSTCAECLLCNGMRENDRRASIAIYLHGSSAGRAHDLRHVRSLPFD